MQSPVAKTDAFLNVESTLASVATMEPVAATLLPAPQLNPGDSAHRAFAAGNPFPVAADSSSIYAASGVLTEGALARALEATAHATLSAGALAPSIESLRHAVGSALVGAGHDSAAQLLGAGAWNLEASSLRIEIPGIRQKMLSLTINGAAEKVIRQELQRMGAPTRFMVIPGEGAASTAKPVSTAPLAGSIQETALGNPLVQRAREIFNAEVRSVVDLRQK
jgi:DNA polymerase-3 subunit gamma/tau